MKEGSRWAKGEVRWKDCKNVKTESEKSVPWVVRSGPSPSRHSPAHKRGKSTRTNQCDPDMYAAIRQEPMHERPFAGHHVRVFLRLLRRFLRVRERWAGELTGRRPVQARGVRRWVEFGGFLEDTGLMSGTSDLIENNV